MPPVLYLTELWCLKFSFSRQGLIQYLRWVGRRMLEKMEHSKTKHRMEQGASLLATHTQFLIKNTPHSTLYAHDSNPSSSGRPLTDSALSSLLIAWAGRGKKEEKMVLCDATTLFPAKKLGQWGWLGAWRQNLMRKGWGNWKSLAWRRGGWGQTMIWATNWTRRAVHEPNQFVAIQTLLKGYAVPFNGVFRKS